MIDNLYTGLMRPVQRDHDGTGTIFTHRLYQRSSAAADVAFIDLVVLPPQTSIGLHRHADDRETYVVLSGQGRMHLDGEEFDVRSGDVVPNLPYGRHGLANVCDTDLHLLVFEIGPLGSRNGTPGADCD